MRKYTLNEITLMQYIFIIHGAQVGVGITTLPRELAQSGGTDGWITLLLTWLVVVFLSILIIWVMQQYPEDTIYDLLKRYFGPYLGSFFQVAWILYTIAISVFVFVSSILVIKIWILPQTQLYSLVLLFSIPLFLVARNGIRVIGRNAEIVFYLTTGFILVFLFVLEYANWLNLRPILKEGWLPVIEGIPNTLFSFLGFELAFILYPFLMKKNQAIKGIVIANSITLGIYLFVTIICFIHYSPYGIINYVWPPLSLLKVIELPLLERFEVLFLSLYMLVFSTTIIPYLFSAMFGMSQLFHIKDHQKILAAFLTMLVILSIFFTPSYSDVEKLKPLIIYASIFFTCVFPVMLWFWGFFYKRKGRVS